MRLTLITLLAFVSYAVGEDDTDTFTLKYTKETFAEEIVKNNHFVMFYAPWCGHCKRLHPTWDILAQEMNHGKGESTVLIAKVDCTTDGELCDENDVTGYPTLQLFKLGEEKGIKFKGSRDLPTLTSFIYDQLGTKPVEADEKMSVGLVELTEDTFEKFIATGKHFVKFYAPWCGHCQKLAEPWEELAKEFEYDETIRISKVDCTTQRTLCGENDIKGYPTLLWFEDGKKVEKYQGSRSFGDLKEYVNTKSGSYGAQKEDKVVEVAEDDNASHVMVLTGESFKHGTETGLTFVKFFAPWCGHCKRLAPTWEELGKKFIGNPSVDIVKVDCTAEINKQLCNDEELTGFPTLLLYKDGQRLSEYNGSRSLQDLYDFVQQHLGVHDEL